MNFDQSAFDVFNQPDLSGRMTAIQARIQPVFQYYGDILAAHLKEKTNQTEVYVHIAKHLRRTTYPPESTWVAIGGDRRGYKKYPHFQIGINEQYVFFVMALIDNPLYEKEIARHWQKNLSLLNELPQDFIVIPDHTQFDYLQDQQIDWNHLVERLEKVKKSELMIGKIYPRGHQLLSDESAFKAELLATMETLIPLYCDGMLFYS